MKNKTSSPKGGLREVSAIALPMVVSYACETVMIFTDRLFLSRLGPELMNASMAGGTTVYMMMTFLLGLTGYTTALAAQYMGAGQKQKAPVVLTQAVFIILLGYPLVLACRPLVHAMFAHAGIPPEQLGPQLIYFNAILLFVFIPLFRHALSSYFTGIGRTRVVMIAALVSMVVNVGANYLLIFGKFGFPALGIRGAAYATIIGATFGLIVLLVSYFRSANWHTFLVEKSLRFDRTVMARLLRFGTPPGIEMFLNLLAFNLLVLIFHAAGPVAATASTIALNWDMVTYIPLMGLEIGITSLVGRYMGGRDVASARASTASALRMGFAYSFMILLIFSFFARPLVDIFLIAANPALAEAVRPLAVFMMRLIILYVWVQAMFVVWIGSLRGAGDTWWTMWFSVILHWVMVPILYVMLHIYHLPIKTAWITIIAVFMASSAILYARYVRGKWQHIRVVEEGGQAGGAG